MESGSWATLPAEISDTVVCGRVCAVVGMVRIIVLLLLPLTADIVVINVVTVLCRQG